MDELHPLKLNSYPCNNITTYSLSEDKNTLQEHGGASPLKTKLISM